MFKVEKLGRRSERVERGSQRRWVITELDMNVDEWMSTNRAVKQAIARIDKVRQCALNGVCLWKREQDWNFLRKRVLVDSEQASKNMWVPVGRVDAMMLVNPRSG